MSSFSVLVVFILELVVSNTSYNTLKTCVESSHDYDQPYPDCLVTLAYVHQTHGECHSGSVESVTQNMCLTACH